MNAFNPFKYEDSRPLHRQLIAQQDSLGFSPIFRFKPSFVFIGAIGYNVVAIPLAAGVLFSAGILISPALGAVLMSLSTIIVAINAQFLKRKLKINT